MNKSTTSHAIDQHHQHHQHHLHRHHELTGKMERVTTTHPLPRANIAQPESVSESPVNISALSATSIIDPDRQAKNDTLQFRNSAAHSAKIIVNHRKGSRTRRAFSCDMCRQRKIRCDQRRPQCSSCTNRNNACVYGAAEMGTFVAVLKTITKRIQKKKHTRATASSLSNQSSTSRSAMGKTDAESLSSLAKHLLKGISQQGQTLLPSPTTEQCPIGRPVAPVSFTVGVTPSQLHHRLPKSPPISPAVYPVADEWTQEVIAAEATLSRCTSVNEHLPSPILSASVSDDDSTSYNDINHKKKDDDDDDDDSGGRHRSSKTLVKVLQKAVLNPSISVASLKCPDPAVVQHLITIYVRRTHPQLPLFSLSWLNGLISSGNIPLGLLTAIMALGARFSKKLPRSGEIGGLLNNQARMLLQRSLDNPDVTTVQTAILTSVYFYSEGNGPMAFACQSLSYRLSRIVQNKLRQMSAVSSNKLNGMDDNSINYDETWRRTWWYTFMSNRFSSARTGQAFGEHFTKQEVPMPTEECNDMVGGTIEEFRQNLFINANKKYYPEFDGPIREESTSEACKGEQHGPLLAKYQYARLFILIKLLEKVVCFTREVANWSSCTGEEKEALKAQQRRLQYEWCSEAKMLASFNEIHTNLQRLKANRLSKPSVSKLGTPTVAARPQPTSARIAAPMLMPPEETQAITVDLSATLYSAFLHALHRTLLIQLMSPSITAPMHASPTDEYSSIRALFDERLNGSKTAVIELNSNNSNNNDSNDDINATTTDRPSIMMNLEPLSMCLGAALEITQIAELVSVDTVTVMHGYYQQSLCVAAGVFLNVIENESAWQLMDPVSCIIKFAQLLDTLGRYSCVYAMAELQRVNMLGRFWSKCTSGIQRLRTTPGGLQLLQSPALQRTRYPGTAWDPHIMASFGI